MKNEWREVAEDWDHVAKTWSEVTREVQDIPFEFVTACGYGAGLGCAALLYHAVCWVMG